MISETKPLSASERAEVFTFVGGAMEADRLVVLEAELSEREPLSCQHRQG